MESSVMRWQMQAAGVLVLVAWPAMAQVTEPAAPEGALSEIRNRETLTDPERAQIETFVRENIATVAQGQAPAVEAFTRLRGAAQGSAAFRRAYATAVIDAASTAYKKAEVESAARLIVLVNLLETVDAVPLLLEALQDSRSGVRAAAAVGLYRLRPALAGAGGESLGRVLTALETAGRQAKSATLLESVYKALDYGALESPPNDPRLRQVLLALLGARAEALAGGDDTAAGGDAAGLRAARRLVGQLNEAERRTLLSALGAHLRFALERYTTGPRKLADVRDAEGSRQLLALRNRIEETIIVGEELLAQLLNVEAGQRPNVYGAMRDLETVTMKNEWQRWNELLKSATGTDFALREAGAPTTQPSGAP